MTAYWNKYSCLVSKGPRYTATIKGSKNLAKKKYILKIPKRDAKTAMSIIKNSMIENYRKCLLNTPKLQMQADKLDQSSLKKPFPKKKCISFFFIFFFCYFCESMSQTHLYSVKPFTCPGEHLLVVSKSIQACISPEVEIGLFYPPSGLCYLTSKQFDQWNQHSPRGRSVQP